MNSQALVKIETKTSWMERALGVRGARLLLAAGGTAAVVLSIPPELLEQIAGTTGLSELSPHFVAPIGLGVRLALAGGAALIPAAIVWTIWRPRRMPAAYAPVANQITQEDDPETDDGFGDDETMMQAQKQPTGSPWGALIRLVRGDAGDSQDASLSRRRRDRHPDAPPRPPLFASRDLPAHDAEMPIDASDDQDFAAPESGFAAQSLAEAVTLARPQTVMAPFAAPPRSPEPMSEAEIARVMSGLPARAVAPAPVEPDAPAVTVESIGLPDIAAPVAAPVSKLLQRDSAEDLLRELDLPLLESAGLADLAARFERGLAKREAIEHAQDAQQSLSSSIAYVQPDPIVRAALRATSPLDLVAAPIVHVDNDDEQPEDPLMRVDADVEYALNTALTTLRKLTEQGRR